MRRRGRASLLAAALLGVLALAGPSIARADPPTGDFSWSRAVVGAKVTFTSTASDPDDALTVSWDFGDGSSPVSGLTASHTYSTPGDETVTMTMANGTDTVPVTHTVHVDAPPIASFIFSPQTPATDQAVQFFSTSSDPDGDTLSYSWHFGDGSAGSTSAAPQHTYTQAGTYHVGLTVTDPTGATDSVVETVTIQNTQPSADFSSAPAVALPAQPVTFTASTKPAVNHTITGVDWNFDYAGTPDQFQVDASGGTATHAFLTPGLHAVAVRVTQSGGGFTIVTHTVTVDSPPVAAFAFAPASPVAGDTVVFASSSSDPDGPIASIAWDLNGDGRYDDASGPVASKQFTAPGSYTIGLRVTDAQGATAFAITNLNVRPIAPALGVLQNVLIQMAGSVTGKKTTVRRLYVRAPAGATASARCQGRRCPVRVRVRSLLSRGHRIRFRRLERAYGAGAKLVVAVTMPGFLDRVTSFKMRAGRPPVRLDRCRFPGKSRLTRCPP
jgi:PKD repeat protein